jgi:hypothetical protein
VLVWEILFVLVILKIPVAYVCWVIWWAVRAEPEPGFQGEPESGQWLPWRRGRSRPPRGGPHGGPSRAGARPRPQKARA